MATTEPAPTIVEAQSCTIPQPSNRVPPPPFPPPAPLPLFDPLLFKRLGRRTPSGGWSSHAALGTPRRGVTVHAAGARTDQAAIREDAGSYRRRGVMIPAPPPPPPPNSLRSSARVAKPSLSAVPGPAMQPSWEGRGIPRRRTWAVMQSIVLRLFVCRRGSDGVGRAWDIHRAHSTGDVTRGTGPAARAASAW